MSYIVVLSHYVARLRFALAKLRYKLQKFPRIISFVWELVNVT